MKFWHKLLKSQAGATAVEYGLIVALICIAMLAALIGLGDATFNTWNNVSNQVVANS